MMAIKSKKIGIIVRHTPYGSDFAQEGIEAILAASVYEQTITVIFVGDGVLQALEKQQPLAGGKCIQKQLSAFEMYDINRLFVCEQSLEERGLVLEALCLPMEPLSPEAIRQLTHEQDVLLSL